MIIYLKYFKCWNIKRKIGLNFGLLNFWGPWQFIFLWMNELHRSVLFFLIILSYLMPLWRQSAACWTCVSTVLVTNVQQLDGCLCIFNGSKLQVISYWSHVVYLTFWEIENDYFQFDVFSHACIFWDLSQFYHYFKACTCPVPDMVFRWMDRYTCMYQGI